MRTCSSSERAAARKATLVPAIRRATNPIAMALARSIHGRSSTTMRTGGVLSGRVAEVAQGPRSIRRSCRGHGPVADPEGDVQGLAVGRTPACRICREVDRALGAAPRKSCLSQTEPRQQTAHASRRAMPGPQRRAAELSCRPPLRRRAPGPRRLCRPRAMPRESKAREIGRSGCDAWSPGPPTRWATSAGPTVRFDAWAINGIFGNGRPARFGARRPDARRLGPMPAASVQRTHRGPTRRCRRAGSTGWQILVSIQFCVKLPALRRARCRSA